jgi:hypothetical protein
MRCAAEPTTRSLPPSSQAGPLLVPERRAREWLAGVRAAAGQGGHYLASDRMLTCS